MITAAPEVNALQSLTGSQPEFQVSSPHGNRVFISPSISVRKADSSVSFTWPDISENPEASSSVGQLLNRFVEEAEEGVRRYPESARALTNLAIALVKRGDLDQGIDVAQSAIKIEGRNYLALSTLAGAFFRKGLFEVAQQLYLDMADHWTADPRPLVAAATVCLRLGNYDYAEQLLCKAVALDEKSAETHFILGVVRINRSDISKAVAALRVASHLDVRNPVFHHNLGVAYALSEEYERAEREFRVSLALSRKDGLSVTALGLVLLQRKAPLQAIEILRPYVESHQGDDKARQILARAYIDCGRHGLGRSLLKAILNQHGDTLDPLIRVNLINDLGRSFMLEGKSKEAEITLRRAIEIGPTASPVPYENLARTYLFHLDQPESAIEILQRSKRLFPKAQITRVLLSGAFAQEDQDGLAISELESFWKDGTAARETYASLGWLYGRIGKVDKALEVLGEGYSKHPRDIVVVNNLAYTYLLCGRVDDAKRVLATLPKTQAPTPHLTATIGLLRLWEGHEKLGRELYERAEHLAMVNGNRALARQLRQKMHLELARFYVRMGNHESARIEIDRGLAEGAFPLSFMKELQELRSQV